jgi:hypothetical protein
MPMQHKKGVGFSSYVSIVGLSLSGIQDGFGHNV